MSADDLADQVWREMSAFVLDNRDGWRRAVVDRSGLPFSRIRILKRLSRHPMTVKQIAAAATVDAPAATVAVNDLEERGLVVREVDPDNRRCKVVSLTDAGRDMVRLIEGVHDPAPQSLRSLDPDDLVALRRILDTAAGPWTGLDPHVSAAENRHRRVVAADARDRASATGSGAAQQDPIVGGGHSPPLRG